MLFNSFEFIFFFLPVTLVVFFLLTRHRLPQMAIAWLVAASLFFYAWWNPIYLGLLIGSILFNYSFGAAIGRAQGARRRALLVIGIGANLAVLGYYKYANFFLDNLNMVLGSDWDAGKILLPLGVSFITFQKIAWLVDAYQGKAREQNFLHFCLFVTFFPQLIAGPIVHHRDVMPQFAERGRMRFDHENISIGMSIFVIGLFKKIAIADNLALYANPVFAAAAGDTTLSFQEAWLGALAYTFQLYFDFSGYSDMAIGLARLFGVKLPLNFHSPYKATSIIDFWRRWHMTLSRFLRDYLYIPLGGGRHGAWRRYRNLVVTMLLGGLWHGAAWTFVIWGGLHGVYLLINHAWRALIERLGLARAFDNRVALLAGGALTFVAVVVGWVFFRAENLAAAQSMLASMAGVHGADPARAFANGLIGGSRAFGWVFAAALMAWLLPNTQQLFARFAPALDSIAGTSRWHWRPSAPWLFFIAALALVAIYRLNHISQFLYFQF